MGRECGRMRKRRDMGMKKMEKRKKLKKRKRKMVARENVCVEKIDKETDS
jgi:hypothetical protein